MSTITIDMEHLAMDIDMDMGIDMCMDMEMDGEPSLEFLLKPLTASQARRAFRGRKSLALLHSWDEIVYRNIKRVFKYKEFEKEWAHIARNEERLMQRVIERKKRHKARALRHKASSSSRSRRSGSSKKAIVPLRLSRSKVPKAKASSVSTKTKAKDMKVTEPKQISSKAIKAIQTSPARKATIQASPPKIKIVNGCTYFYPSVAEKKEQSIADGYDTLSSNSHSV